MAIPLFKTSSRSIFCLLIYLGFLALGRAGFAMKNMDIAPRYAGILMGISNTAGTLAGIVGVGLIGNILKAVKAANRGDLSAPEC